MVNGTIIILVLLVVSGFIAYFGDRVGMKVGKRRISIFGLRPKYSSIIVTIVSGILIYTVSIGAVLLIFEEARKAFFGLQKIEAQLKKSQEELKDLQVVYKSEEDRLKQSIKDTSSELEASNLALVESRDALQDKQNQLDSILGEINLKSIELADLHSSYDEMETKVETLDSHRKDLESKKKQLEKKIEDLKLEYTAMIGATKQELLFGDIIYKKEQPLYRIAAPDDISDKELEARMVHILNIVFKTAIEKGAVVEEEASLLFRQQFESLLELRAESDEDMIVEVRSHTNVLSGQPIYVTMNIVDNKLVFKKNEVISSEVIEKGLSQREISEILKRMLTDTSIIARKAGLIPDIDTGRVGTVPAKRYIEIINELVGITEPRTIELYVVDDVKLSDALNVDFRIL